jgi:uncharacterized protein (DUF885 family)
LEEESVKRRYLAAIAVIAALVIAGCSSSGGGSNANQAGGSKTLTVWLMDGSAPDQLVSDLNKEFQAAHQGVTVNYQVQKWDGILDKLTTALASNAPPDVIELGNTQAANFSSSGALRDLSDKAADLGSQGWLQGMTESGQWQASSSRCPSTRPTGSSSTAPTCSRRRASAARRPPSRSGSRTARSWPPPTRATRTSCRCTCPARNWYFLATLIWDNGGDLAVKNGDKWQGAVDTPQAEAGIKAYQDIYKAMSKAPADLPAGHSDLPAGHPGLTAGRAGRPGGVPSLRRVATPTRLHRREAAMDTELARIANDYFRRWMVADPFTATEFGVPGHDAEVPDPSREAEDAYAAELDRLATRARAVDPATLDPDERVTRSMLLRTIGDQRAELAARLSEVAVTATTTGVQTRLFAVIPRAPLSDAERARGYLERCRKLGDYLDGVLERYRQAKAEGRFPPARGVRQTIAQLDDYLASDLREDPLLRPAPPAEVDADAWRREAAEIVTTVVRPALDRYRAALADELLPVGRDDDHVGVCHLAGGADGYAAALRTHTTTDLTPEQIHQTGLELLDGLGQELADLGGRVLGTSEVPEILERLRTDASLRFRGADEILGAAHDALRRAEEALPDAFRDYDLAPCVVEPIDPVEAKDSVLGYYLPATADGTRPGIYNVNTYAPQTRPRFEYEALTFHESVPGHHLQFALAQRLSGIPEFRRFAYVTAYCEGWALYTERLCDELGLYSGDLDRFGMLSFDAWRAARLVVDTGMHYFGWSRDRAVALMRDGTALSQSNIDNEVDRYIAWPGQATAYMVGRLHIRALRERARERLGPSFDLKTFHDTVLTSGPVPLDTLDDLVDAWTQPAASP